MKHYIKPNGGIWAFEPDGSQDHLITPDMAPITSAALAALQSPTLQQNIAALVAKIRTDANKIVSDTVGALSNEYAQAKTDADAFKAAAYLGAVPSSVSSWATAKGWTAMQACDDILTAAANWVGAQAAIRSNRLARSEAAKACATQEQLDTVAAQWAGFVVAIRSSLGV